jgi:hypothetical protein
MGRGRHRGRPPGDRSRRRGGAKADSRLLLRRAAHQGQQSDLRGPAADLRRPHRVLPRRQHPERRARDRRLRDLSRAPRPRLRPDARLRHGRSGLQDRRIGRRHASGPPGGELLLPARARGRRARRQVLRRAGSGRRRRGIRLRGGRGLEYAFTSTIMGKLEGLYAASEQRQRRQIVVGVTNTGGRRRTRLGSTTRRFGLVRAGLLPFDTRRRGPLGAPAAARRPGASAAPAPSRRGHRGRALFPAPPVT